MAKALEKAAEHLSEITECSICRSAFIDPRMLPCIHTFCLECLNRTGEADQRKPGDKMPCPLCRKEFIIPEDGMNGVQKNFFMENLLEFKETLQVGSDTIICGMCNIRKKSKTGQIPKATVKCLECQDYYCDKCVKVHQFHKLSKHHQMINIGSDMKSETRRMVSTKSCPKHSHNLLNYYCADCKKIVCVSCFVESHKLHDCKDVTTVDEEFCQTIEKKARKISTCVKEMLFMRNHNEKRKEDFLKQIVVAEKEIYDRNQELKDMIDQHTKSLLDELSVRKSKHLKEMETGMEEIDRYCTILASFEAYCTELTSKGSASDICSSVDELIARADDLERDNESFLCRPHKSFEVSFHATNLGNLPQNANINFVGEVKAKSEMYENFAVAMAVYKLGSTTRENIVKINLHQPNDTTTLKQIQTGRYKDAAAAVYDNTMYVAGIGCNADEIWKFNKTSGWIECASLVQDRTGHSVAFINEVLFICGGYAYSSSFVVDSVEAFNADVNKCTAVGKLVHGVYMSRNCVPFKNSLYIFGGAESGLIDVRHVQVYNTKENTCTLLARSMPRPHRLMQAILWETSVILLGSDTCFIFNIETETWEEREQFKTDVVHFGLVLENERVFVIRGGNKERGQHIWKCRNDVRYVPLQRILEEKLVNWKIHVQLPEGRQQSIYYKSVLNGSSKMWRYDKIILRQKTRIPSRLWRRLSRRKAPNPTTEPPSFRD